MKKITNIIKETYAGILISLCLSYMLLFYEPLNIFANNMGDFWFDIYQFFPIVVVQFLIAFIFLSIFFIIVRKINKKVYAFFVVSFLIGTICTYIQGNFLAGSLPAIDGTWIDFDKFKTEKIISILLWLVVLGVILFSLYKFKFKTIEKVSMYASIVIMLMLSSSYITIFTQEGFFDSKANLVATVKNFNTMSSEKNFVIFLLDTVDSKTFYKELEKSGKKEELFKDFTYYPDTLGAYPFTRNSIPFVLSGKWYENEKKFGDYFTEAIETSPLFEELENENYQMNLYEYDLNEYKGDSYQRFDNLSVKFGMNISKLIKEEMKMIMYKYLPYQLKWRAKIDTLNMSDVRDAIDVVSDNNIKFYNNVTSQKFEVEEQNNFKFIHIEGAHLPFRYDKDLNVLENGTYEGNNDACVTLIEAYLNKLRESNLYDNTAIVILSDHGFGDGAAGTNRQNPILFIKGFNEHHDFKTSNEKVSFANLIETYKNLMAGKTSEELFKNIDNTERRFLFCLYDSDSDITEYTLKGNAWDSNALKPTGKKYVLK